MTDADYIEVVTVKRVKLSTLKTRRTTLSNKLAKATANRDAWDRDVKRYLRELTEIDDSLAAFAKKAEQEKALEAVKNA